MSVKHPSKTGFTAVANIRNSLLVGLLVSCLLILVMSLVSLNEIRSLNLKLEDVVEASEVKTGLLYDMRLAARDRNLHLMMSLLIEDEFLRDEEWIKFREQGGEFLKAREEYRAMAFDKTEIDLLEQQRQISVKAVEQQYILYDMILLGNRQGALDAIKQTLDFQSQVFDVLDRMLELQKQRNATIVKQARTSQQTASQTVIILGMVVVVFIVLSTAYIIQRISQQARSIENEGMKFKALIEGSMDSVIVLSEGKIIDANENALKMFSVDSIASLSELGERFTLRFRVDEKDENPITIADAIERAEIGLKTRYHWYFSDFNDEEISVDVEVTAIDLQGDKLVQVVIRDVTEREIFQRALKELNESLENKVHERTEELKDLNSKIAAIARSAGMAEVASGVLHNVGNVLNSINVSTSVLKEQIKNCRAANIEKISQLLSENKNNLCDFLVDDEKGRYVLPYIEKLSVQIKEERDSQVKELECLGDNIEHIKTIISMQQSYAGGMGMIDTITASELFEDAVKINITSLDNNRIGVVYDFRDDPKMVTDKHKIIQILVNLISNAKYALMNNDLDDRRLMLGIRQDGETIVFSVEDNGVGIEQENIGRLFEFGFKKREGGHGYGLHHSALVARELGGKIEVSSEGKHKGAVFCLYVPREYKAAEAGHSQD